MLRSWLGRQRLRYMQAARSGRSMPRLRIAVGVAFLALAGLAAFDGKPSIALLNAVAGSAMLLDGIILLRLR